MFDDLKQVERLMKQSYIGSGPYDETKQQGLIDMFTDDKLASHQHQTVSGSLYSGAAAYPYLLIQRCNHLRFSQVFVGQDLGVIAEDNLPCLFRDAFVQTSFSDQQLLISDSTLKVWTDFAKFGDPNGDSKQGAQLWNPGQTMVFGVSGKITLKEEWRDRMFIWDRLYWQTKRETLVDELYSEAEITACLSSKPVWR